MKMLAYYHGKIRKLSLTKLWINLRTAVRDAVKKDKESFQASYNLPVMRIESWEDVHHVPSTHYACWRC